MENTATQPGSGSPAEPLPAEPLAAEPLAAEPLAAEPLGAEPLGVGATILSSVFALLVGIVVGVITTFTHAVVFPEAAAAGLAIVAALVGGFRLVFDSRVVGAASAVGVLAASAALSFPGAGGVVLTLNGPAGWVWAIGPLVVCAIVLLAPRRMRP